MSAKKSKISKNQIEFRVNKIELLSSFIGQNDKLNIPDPKQLKFKLIADLEVLSSAILITINYEFLYQENILLEFKSNTEFGIKEGLNHAIENNQIKNEKFIKHLIFVSLCHARGLQSTLINNTQLEHFYIPLIPPDKIQVRLKTANPPTP